MLGGVELAGVLTTARTVMEGGGGHEQTAGEAEEAQQRLTNARERALVAKRRELAAHERAIKWHEDAAESKTGSAFPIGPPVPVSMLGRRGS
jgi:hypothetical protein